MRRGVLAPSNAALVEMAVGLTPARSAARSPPRTRPGSCCSLAEPTRSRRDARSSRRPPSAARPGDPRGDPRGGDRAVRPAAATTRPRCARSPRRRDVQPAAIYHWYPSKEAILVQLQDDFMERLTEKVEAAIDRHDRPALRLAAAVREHVVFHGLHRREAFVTDSEIRALTEDAAGGADRQARRLPGDVQRDDPGRDPRRLAARLRCPRRDLRDPAAVHGGGALVRPSRPADARAGRRSSTSSWCSARCRRSAS